MLGRTVIRLALFAAVLLVAAGPLRDATRSGGDGEHPLSRIPDPPARGVPPQFAGIVAGMRNVQRGSPAGRFGRIGRHAGRAGAGSAAGATRPFADRGSRRQIARLRRDVARALRDTSTPDDRVAVLAWQGVYVSGRRALAIADVRRAVRSRRGMPFRHPPPARTRLELVRDGRTWRVHDVAALRR